MFKTIVMIGNTSWGMLQFRAETMKHFMKNGHKVVVIAPLDEYSIKLQELGCHFIPLSVDRKGTNPLLDLLYTIKLAQILMGIKADVILTYTIKPVLYGTIAAKLAGVPKRIAVTTGLGYVFSKENLISKFTNLLLKFGLQFASEVWFLNKDDEEVFLRKGIVSKNKSFILPGEGVDTDHYMPKKNAQSKVTFTLISRMLWDKGINYFVDCAEQLKGINPNLEFLLVGPIDEGNPESISLAQIMEWHEKGLIKYLGPKSDIREVLKETSCLIHPTYYKEGIPRILMEANSMSIPCITTNISGCREVIQDGVNGYLVEPKSVESLKQAVLKFINLDPEEVVSLGKVARELMIKNYSSERINHIYDARLNL